MNYNFVPCKLCIHSVDEKDKSWWGDCYDCVGDHSRFSPSKEFTQFLNKANFQLVPHKTIKIILGFPGVGKSFCKEHFKGTDIKILDSDSSEFPKSDFPNNYIKHIRETIQKNIVDIMFISSHKDVRKAIFNDNFIMSRAAIYICYPDKKLKEDFIDRYKKRGNNEKFIKLISDNWETWIDEIENENYFYPLKLTYKEQYLKNLLYEVKY